MAQQFVETIKIAHGKAQALAYHQARMERAIRHFFPLASIPSLESVVRPEEGMDLYKCRVVYGAHGVETIDYAPYVMRDIRTLQVVTDDAIDYSYKRTDRSSLNALTARRGHCDEIIIVKQGLITDTSFTNLALFIADQWLTPRHPLLLGTKRANLLERGIIREADLTLYDLQAAQRVCLFNAMIEFGDIELFTPAISY